MLFQSCRLLLTLGDPAPVKIFNSPRAKLRSTHSLACKILEGNLTPWAFLRPYSALDLLPFLSGLGLLLLAVGSGTGWPSPWPGPGAKSSWRLPLSHRLILIWESSSRLLWRPGSPRPLGCPSEAPCVWRPPARTVASWRRRGTCSAVLLGVARGRLLAAQSRLPPLGDPAPCLKLNGPEQS
jgi:hypothetical protein